MSQENVELVRALQPGPDVDFMQFFFRDDDEGARAALPSFAPAFADDFEAVFRGVSDRTYHGLLGLRECWLDWLEPWESYRTEIEQLIDAGDRVLLLSRDFGRRRDMDAEVMLFGSAVYTVSDGKVARVEFFQDRQRAFDAVGLPQQNV